MTDLIQLAAIVAVVVLCALLKFRSLRLEIPGLKLEINPKDGVPPATCHLPPERSSHE